MAGEISVGTLLHPGGGGAQYPFRFKPSRPRGLWRRTPGPRPPRGPVNMSTMVITLVVVGAVAAAIVIAFASGWLGLSDGDEPVQLTVEHVEETGFVIETNLIDDRARVLHGEFRGIRASILIPLSGQSLTAGIPEVDRAREAQQFGTGWQALRAGESLVLCNRTPECEDLLFELAEAVFSS